MTLTTRRIDMHPVRRSLIADGAIVAHHGWAQKGSMNADAAQIIRSEIGDFGAVSAPISIKKTEVDGVLNFEIPSALHHPRQFQYLRCRGWITHRSFQGRKTGEVSRTRSRLELPAEEDAQENAVDNQHQPVDGNHHDFKTIQAFQAIRYGDNDQ